MAAGRMPIVAGNWKMHNTVEESLGLVEGLKGQVTPVQGVEIVVCPVFTALQAVGQALAGSNIALGAQNCYHEARGAFTGEVAPQMLRDVGCAWVIIGHSERRQLFQEQDAFLNKKLHFALESGLKVMFCIGETLEEREGGVMDDVLKRQVFEGLEGVSEGAFENLVIAYEPVWAIGTGVTASPEQAEEAHAFVRGLLEQKFSAQLAARTRIQYGGSVKADNAGELIAKDNVDGFLVGGAALQAETFAKIIQAAA